MIQGQRRHIMIAIYLTATGGPNAIYPSLNIHRSRIIGISSMDDSQIAISLEGRCAAPFTGAGISHLNPAPPGSPIIRTFPAIEIHAIATKNRNTGAMSGNGKRTGKHRAYIRPGRPVGAARRRRNPLIIKNAGSTTKTANRAIARHSQTMISTDGAIPQSRQPLPDKILPLQLGGRHGGRMAISGNLQLNQWLTGSLYLLGLQCR